MCKDSRSGTKRNPAGDAGSLVATAAVLVSLLLTPVAASADDPVLEWNRIALAATVTAGQAPIVQIRTMAIVQVSVHDAVNAITCDYRTYLSISCGPWGSPEAAAIAAAHRALVGLFPAQAPALNVARATSLAAHGFTETDPGIAFGEAVTAVILAIRSNDGSAQAQFPYRAPGAGNPGVWVAVGPAAPLLPGWGNVALWVLRSLSQFEPDGPPPLHSRRYARDYNEVKEIGSLTSQTRTDEQTEIARFWLATPTAIWNGVARQVIQARGLDLSATARALALMYLASADASIACWKAKYTFNFWRPITAIRNGELDDNPRTLPDLAWTPLFPTPQHPEYLSGHATNSGAMATVLMLLFGDEPNAPIVATSPTNPGFERYWGRLSEGVEEVIEARIYAGIHYRTSDEEGAQLGRKIARFVVNHALRVRRPDRSPRDAR
jgi:PAP2 superfamily